jgi:seryl-tRNA synthetase
VCPAPDGSALLITTIGDGRSDAVVEAVRRVEAGVRGKRLLSEQVVRTIGDRVHPAATSAVSEGRTVRAQLGEELDRAFQRLAADLDPQPRDYGSLLDDEVMRRCQYVAQFPQNTCFLAELPHSIVTLEDAAGALEELVRPSGEILAPAVCFHCYAELADRSLDRTWVLNARSQCFRHEAPWRLGPFRRRDFAMREIVFIGDPDEVEAHRTRMLDRSCELFEQLGFAGCVQRATDPFYFPRDDARRTFQAMSDGKFELVVALPDGGSAAVASFNNVRDSICKGFAITFGGKTAHSGCAAYGIDRWVEAAMAYGPDAILANLRRGPA